MTGSFSAEVLKLRKRPATWVLGAIPVAVLIAYYLTLYFTTQSLGQRLSPAGVPANTAEVVALIGGPVALIFGTLVAGSEYGWDTLKVALPRRQSRPGFLGGKLLTVGAGLATLCVLLPVVGLATTYLITLLAGGTAEWPSFAELAQGAGVAWLILAAWGALGAFLAVLFRGTSLAIGIGLVYALVVETLLSSIPGEFVAMLSKYLIGNVSGALTLSLGGGTGAGVSALDPGRAVLTLGVYLLASLVLAPALFYQRDVT